MRKASLFLIHRLLPPEFPRGNSDAYVLFRSGGPWALNFLGGWPDRRISLTPPNPQAVAHARRTPLDTWRDRHSMSVVRRRPIPGIFFVLFCVTRQVLARHCHLKGACEASSLPGGDPRHRKRDFETGIEALGPTCCLLAAQSGPTPSPLRCSLMTHSGHRPTRNISLGDALLLLHSIGFRLMSVSAHRGPCPPGLVPLYSFTSCAALWSDDPTHSVCLVRPRSHPPGRYRSLRRPSFEADQPHLLCPKRQQRRRIPNAPHYSASQLGRVLKNRD